MSAPMRVERAGDVAVLRMEAGRANAMGAAFLADLGRAIGEASGGARALVVTGYDRFFSAGLDLPSLLDLDRHAMRAFIDTFDRTMEQLFALRIPTVAAVNGHAIAGGCVLALQCDRRIMATGPGLIGLSEVALGIGLPPTVIEPLRLRLPGRSFHDVALTGRLLSAMQARELDLVDEAIGPAELETRALAVARELGALGPEGYAQIKGALQAPALERIHSTRTAELERWLDSWFSPSARALLVDAIARIRKK